MLLHLYSEFTQFLSQFSIFSRQTHDIRKHCRPDNSIGGKQKPEIFHAFSPNLTDKVTVDFFAQIFDFKADLRQSNAFANQPKK